MNLDELKPKNWDESHRHYAEITREIHLSPQDMSFADKERVFIWMRIGSGNEVVLAAGNPREVMAEARGRMNKMLDQCEKDLAQLWEHFHPSNMP